MGPRPAASPELNPVGMLEPPSYEGGGLFAQAPLVGRYRIAPRGTVNSPPLVCRRRIETSSADQPRQREIWPSSGSNPPAPARQSAFQRISFFGRERPAKCGLFSPPMVSGDRCSNFFGRTFPKVSSRIQENSRFPETRHGDPRINPLRGRVGSAPSSQSSTRRS
jgi:hypothetical protein